MHGEPSWSFLYRKIVASLAARGHRVVAPDLVGFGRSDKPADQSDYTFERHVRWMSDWLAATRLTDITLFCQDWGGLIGLRLVAAFPEKFARVVVANTGLPTGEGFSAAFQQWLEFSQSIPVLPVGQIVGMGCKRGLSETREGGVRRAVSGRIVQGGCAALSCPGSDYAGTRLGRREQGRVESSGKVHQAFSHCVQRFGSGDERRRADFSAARSGSEGTEARDDHGRGSFSARGQAGRNRRSDPRIYRIDEIEGRKE